MPDEYPDNNRSQRQPRILVVDDDAKIAALQKETLEKANYVVKSATSIPQARKQVESTFFDLLILDERMPSGSGTQFFMECREHYPDIGGIFLTGFPDIKLARDVFKAGALDFLVKGISREQLIIAVEEALRRSQLKRENRYLRHQLAQESTETGIIGESEELQAAVTLARKAAEVDFPVLIEGESGTGKELFAKAIHKMSPRRNGHIVCINMGAIPQSLLESELFGHVKGAFTGAHRHRQGAFESADGGVLFLDEIGEMPLDAQVRLLRVLDENLVTRLGETRVIPVNVRIIAATNKKLDEEVEKGRFREDLFYRLTVLRIFLPPLRIRRDDIAILAQHFLKQATVELHKDITGFTLRAMHMLEGHSWRGNVRELRNVVERSTILCEGNEISAEQLQLHSQARKAPPHLLDMSWKEANMAFGKMYFEAMLNRAKGNKVQCAKLAKIDRSTLYDCLKKFGVSHST